MKSGYWPWRKNTRCHLHIPGLSFPILLKGTLDRVDKFDGTVRVIDYKTGKVESKNVKITDWDRLITDYDKSKAFQLLCYAYLYHKQHGTTQLMAGIHSFKNLGQGLFSFTEEKNTLIDENTLISFETQLYNLILAIFDAKIPLIEKRD